MSGVKFNELDEKIQQLTHEKNELVKKVKKLEQLIQKITEKIEQSVLVDREKADWLEQYIFAINSHLKEKIEKVEKLEREISELKRDKENNEEVNKLKRQINEADSAIDRLTTSVYDLASKVGVEYDEVK